LNSHLAVEIIGKFCHHWGSLQHSLRPPAGFEGLTSKGRWRQGREREERKGKGGKECCEVQKSLNTPWFY